MCAYETHMNNTTLFIRQVHDPTVNTRAMPVKQNLTSHYNSSTSQSTPNNNKQVNEGIKFTTSSTAD